MFRFSMKARRFRILDCPESGLAAIDFRRLHRLPEAPTNTVVTEAVSFEDEELCRLFAADLNTQADLILEEMLCRRRVPGVEVWGSDSRGWREVVHYSSDSSAVSVYEPLVRPGVLRQFLEQVVVVKSAESRRRVVAEMLEEVVLDRLSAKIKGDAAEAIVKQAAERRERQMTVLVEMEATPISALLEAALYKDGSWRSMRELGALFGGYPQKTDVEEMRGLLGRLHAAREELLVRLELEGQEKLRWIGQYGSVTLRGMSLEDESLDDLYMDERLDDEMPGWRYLELDRETLQSIEEPPVGAVALLERARANAPENMEMGLWGWNKPSGTHYVVVAKFLGEKVVYDPDESL